MKKISLILLISLVLITGCSVKEGFTTFGALQNKIDDYLINVDISDDIKSEVDISSDLYGVGSLVGYKSIEANTYIYANLTIDNQENSYEVFYIDESLTYIIYLKTQYESDSDTESYEELVEYIVLDGKPAILDVELNMLIDMENPEELTELINYLESKL